MSRAIRKAIWLRGPESAGQRFVLMAICDFVDLQGRGTVPMAVLCARTCGAYESVQQLLRILEADGWLQRRRDRTDRIVYQISLDKLGVTPEMMTVAYQRFVSPQQQEGQQ